MPLDFRALTPQIERMINMLRVEFSQAPASILTEEDLRCRLYQKLSWLPALRMPTPTLNRHILGSYVHAELSWYDEYGKLRIRPDITIIEPEHMSIVHGYVPPPVIELFGSAHCPFPGAPLPSKQYVFGGRAIALELKFARAGITKSMLRLIKEDFKKMMRLLENLDRTGEGESVFCYLVIFNKLPQRLDETPLANFMRDNRSGPRHKILYKSSFLCPGPKFSMGHSSRGIDLVLTSPPYSRAYKKANIRID
jgi:hypothetical protein